VRDFDRYNPTARKRDGRRRGAFTLIELLVVMGILAVLVAIVAGVAGYVMRSANEKDTSATQAILMDAIQAWHDKDTNTLKCYPFTDPNPNNTGGVLVQCLTGFYGAAWPGPTSPSVRAAGEILLKLPRDAWGGGTNEPVKDAWGVAMRYDAAGGLGGRPVVISAGADGKPNTEDDVRSDESQ